MSNTNENKKSRRALLLIILLAVVILVFTVVFFLIKTSSKTTKNSNNETNSVSQTVSSFSVDSENISEQASNPTDSTSDDTASPDSDTTTDTEEFVILPLLEGEAIEQVKLKLDELGLEYFITEQYHDTVESGKVISQMPEDGTRVTNDNVISIYVSKGKDPDKKEESSAENDDTDNSTKTSDNENPNNTVSENTEQPVLSNKVTVPKIVGTNAQDAMNTLTSLNLYYTGDYAYDDNVPQGQVISQSPQEGTEVEKNSRVNFVISNGKQPEPQEQQIITYEYTVPAEDNTAQNSNTQNNNNNRNHSDTPTWVGKWHAIYTVYKFEDKQWHGYDDITIELLENGKCNMTYYGEHYSSTYSITYEDTPYGPQINLKIRTSNNNFANGAINSNGQLIRWLNSTGTWQTVYTKE